MGLPHRIPFIFEDYALTSSGESAPRVAKDSTELLLL